MKERWKVVTLYFWWLVTYCYSPSNVCMPVCLCVCLWNSLTTTSNSAVTISTSVNSSSVEVRGSGTEMRSSGWGGGLGWEAVKHLIIRMKHPHAKVKNWGAKAPLAPTPPFPVLPPLVEVEFTSVECLLLFYTAMCTTRSWWFMIIYITLTYWGNHLS